MMATPAPGRSAERYRFDRFELQPAARRLLADGTDVRIGARAFDVLLTLVERPGRVVAKDELLATAWPGVIVEEANLAVQISALRKVLGPGLIATVAGRGYQFTGTLEALGSPSEAGAAQAEVARGGVPRAAAPMIGREAELASLAQLMGSHRLVTVSGSGGIGKTRLAMAWCEGPGLGEPLVWIDLSALVDASRLGASVLQRLQAAGLAGPSATDGPASTSAMTAMEAASAGAPSASTATPEARAALASLCQAVSARPLVLVLDNAEPIAAEVAALARALLEAAPRLRLLVTSQVPLRLQAEQVFRLGTLPVPPARVSPAQALEHAAVALFVARARAADPLFELAPGNVTSVVEICRRLEGLPLALELAAARVATIGVNALAAALGHALDGGPDTPPRAPSPGGAAVSMPPGPAGGQLGVQRALAWSHALLDAPAKRVFRRLGVFAGGFTLAAAQAVVGDADDAPEPEASGADATGSERAEPRQREAAADPREGPSSTRLDAWAVMSTLGRLVEHSLVAKDGAEPPRFSLLESARLFALEQLERAREAPDRRARHLDWCLSFVRQVMAQDASPAPVALPAGSLLPGPPSDVSPENEAPPARPGTGGRRPGDAAAARITVEYANLRTALAHALSPGSPLRERGAELAVALLPYWRHVDAADEQRWWTAAAPTPATASTPPAVARTPAHAGTPGPATRAGDTAQQLLERLRADGLLGANGSAAGLDATTVLELARQVGLGDVSTLERALTVLQQAVTVASGVLAPGAGDDGLGTAALDAYVRAMLDESATLADRGDPERGAGLLDVALAELDHREAAHRALLQRSRRALLEAALQADLARRDAASAARRIEALAALDRPGQPTAAPVYREHETAMLLRGMQERDVVSLSVAAQLLRRRLQTLPAAAQDPGIDDAVARERREARLSLARALNRLGASDALGAAIEEARRVCRQALAETSRSVHAQEWASLQHELAIALTRLGERAGDRTMLEEAAACCRLALEERRRERDPEAWSESVLVLVQAERRIGVHRGDVARLEAAVDVGRTALRGLSRAEAGARWARLHSAVAGALGLLARKNGSPALRHEAVASYRAALSALSVESTPQEWGAVQCNLGIELAAIGEAEPGPPGVEALQQAVDAYRAALRVLSLEASPAGWAIAQHNLGGALRLLGEREDGTQSLREATLAFAEALRHHTRERAPGHWAAGQNDRALALLALGRRERHREPVLQAIAALREALLVRRRETSPLDWATTQLALADALAALAEMDGDAATMEAAALAAEAALEELPAERAPNDHALGAARAASARAWLAARTREIDGKREREREKEKERESDAGRAG